MNVAEHADAAIERMRALGVSPTPENFMVWYHYHAGTYPDLRHTLDILLRNRQAFTETRCAEIHAKFFAAEAEPEGAIEASEHLGEQIDRVLSFLKEAEGDTSAFGKALAIGHRRIEQATGAEELKRTISGILSATRQMESRNATLEKQLTASSQEVDKLRIDLEAMRHEAQTDALTGIANRKVFDASLRTAADESMETGDELSLLMIDIDHFKKFNDTYGHQTGDQVLKVLAQVLVGSVKGQDTAARYGGEEFGIVLPATPLRAAKIVGETIRRKVVGKTLINRKTGEKLGKLSVSIGAGRYEAGEPIGKLVARADACLYAAKRRGRDQVVGQDDLTVEEALAAEGV